jgi:CRP-like cAMP-binding protein
LEIAVQEAEAGRSADGLHIAHSSFPLDAPGLDVGRSARIPALSQQNVTQDPADCVACALFSRCGGEDSQQAENYHLDMSRLFYSTHTAAARRTIRHPKEWSEFVLVICSGWAVSSIALPDGRRQVLSILLPGDIVCATSLFEPISGYAVDAITDVSYRRFKRTDLKALLSRNYGLFERLAKIWADESERSISGGDGLRARRAVRSESGGQARQTRHGRRPDDGFSAAPTAHRRRHGIDRCSRQQSVGRVSTSRHDQDSRSRANDRRREGASARRCTALVTKRLTGGVFLRISNT